MSLQEHPLHVHITSPDLPPTELLLQSFNNLELLQQNVTTIFGSLNERIIAQRQRLNNIQSRIKQCNKKVKHIAENPNKVVTVYSNSTFPTHNEHEEVTPKGAVSSLAPTLFKRIIPSDHATDGLVEITNYHLSEQHYMKSTEPVDTTGIFLDLTRATNQRTERNTTKTGTDKEGLGRFPQNIKSVSSVILFNSEENPYKNYDSFNNLDSVADARKRV
eukprot:UN02939